MTLTELLAWFKEKEGLVVGFAEDKQWMARDGKFRYFVTGNTFEETVKKLHELVTKK